MLASTWRPPMSSNTSLAPIRRRITVWLRRRSRSSTTFCSAIPEHHRHQEHCLALNLQQKKFDQAKDYFRKAIQVDPNDPEAYYSIAVIDWTQAYQPRMEERNKLGLKPEDSLAAKDKKVCQEVQTKNTPFVDEGMQMLNKAIELRPDYDDAMAYLNLMWREKADIECGDPAARTQDLKTADEWVDKTLAVKKAKAEKAGPRRYR